MAYIGVSPSNGVRRVFDYTATAGQTSFSGSDNNSQTLAYTDSAYIDVYQNGVLLIPSDYTATTGTSVVLDTGATVSDSVQIVVFDVFSVADTVSKVDGGTFESNISIGGTLGVTGKTGVGTSSPAAAFHVQTTADGTGLSGDDIYVARFQNQEATTDRSFGVDIQAGSSTTDQALRIKDHDGTNTLMIVDGVGHVTKPKQSAFMVRSNQTQSNFTTGSFVTVNFHSERFDQNGDFDNTNMVFTAPVTGRYQFNILITPLEMDSAASYFQVIFDASNVVLQAGLVDSDTVLNSDSAYFMFSGSSLIDMDAGDTCKIRVYQAGGTAQSDLGDGSATFSGYLVC